MLAVRVHRVPHRLARVVGLVFADAEIRQALQALQQRSCDTRVAVPQHPHLPGSADAGIDRREAVHSHHRRHTTLPADALERDADGIVVGVEELLRPLNLLPHRQAPVAGNQDGVAQLDDRGGIAQVTIGIDDEARIPRQHQRGVEHGRQTPGDVGRTDVVGDVLSQGFVTKTQSCEPGRHRVARMITDDEHPCRARRVDDLEGRRLSRCENRPARGCLDECLQHGAMMPETRRECHPRQACTPGADGERVSQPVAPRRHMFALRPRHRRGSMRAIVQPTNSPRQLRPWRSPIPPPPG